MDELNARPIELLLVEVNSGDARLAEEALRDGKLHNRMSIVRDGESALAFLRREGAYADAPRPDLVLLELELPRVDGRAVLGAMRDDPDLRDIPVAVLAASATDWAIIAREGLPTSHYLIKPIDAQRLLTMVTEVASFALTIIRYPDAADE